VKYKALAPSELIVGRTLLKNGLEEKKHEEKVSKILGGVAFCYLALCFLAPLSLPSNSVPELSGRANAIDYAFENSWGNNGHEEGGSVGHDQSLHGGKFAWSDLNPIWALAYGFGDINCHQKHERSWEINGNQMPVCARDIGIFSGFSLGCLFFLLRGFNRWTVRDTFLSVFNDEWLIEIYEKRIPNCPSVEAPQQEEKAPQGESREYPDVSGTHWHLVSINLPRSLVFLMAIYISKSVCKCPNWIQITPCKFTTVQRLVVTNRTSLFMPIIPPTVFECIIDSIRPP
jgi:hypothetical protein